MFVCVEVLWPSQSNGVMTSAVSLPYHTFTGILCTLSGESVLCTLFRQRQLPFLNQRKEMTVENIQNSTCSRSGGRVDGGGGGGGGGVESIIS